MRIFVREKSGIEHDAHYYKLHPQTKPDMFGKLEGYRCIPPGKKNNHSKRGVMYRAIEDVADHLRANPGTGIRVWISATGKASRRTKNVYIDGVPL